MITLKDKKVGFISIGRFPHPKAKDIMVISRLVVVPEFQGFGIGLKFMEAIAEIYKNDRVRITTSLKPFVNSLKKSKNWICVRFGRVGVPGTNSKIYNKNQDCSVSYNRITATFEMRKL